MASDIEELASTVREYFVKNDGRVKLNDLFDHFRDQLDKLNEQGTSKNRFTDIVDSVATLYTLEGEKYFVLKKNKNAHTPVVMRRNARQSFHHRRDKGVSLPASMRNFRFSTAEDPHRNYSGENKGRPARTRTMVRSEASDFPTKRNHRDNLNDENVGVTDNGSDSTSESFQDSRQSSLSKLSDFDEKNDASANIVFYNNDEYNEHDTYSTSNMLTSVEKKWMMYAIKGNNSEITCLLSKEPDIVKFKDFVMGYTALHWAAKNGNEDLVRILVVEGADVNSQSNGGYTPLHLAKMHQKNNVVDILVKEFYANEHIRDHSGNEANDVLGKNTSEQIKLELADSTEQVHDSSFSNNGSPKERSRSKSSASTLFSKKSKKTKTNRPVIEHWDSRKEQRLESCVDGVEKDFDKIEPRNYGSLFPKNFYPEIKRNEYDIPESEDGSLVNDVNERQKSFPGSFYVGNEILENDLSDNDSVDDEIDMTSTSLSNVGARDVSEGEATLMSPHNDTYEENEVDGRTKLVSTDNDPTRPPRKKDVKKVAPRDKSGLSLPQDEVENTSEINTYEKVEGVVSDGSQTSRLSISRESEGFSIPRAYSEGSILKFKRKSEGSALTSLSNTYGYKESRYEQPERVIDSRGTSSNQADHLPRSFSAHNLKSNGEERSFDKQSPTHANYNMRKEFVYGQSSDIVNQTHNVLSNSNDHKTSYDKNNEEPFSKVNNEKNKRELPPYRPPQSSSHLTSPPPYKPQGQRKNPPPYRSKSFELNEPSSTEVVSASNNSKSNPNDINPIAPPRKNRKSSSSDGTSISHIKSPVSQTNELHDPVPPPRKHRSSVRGVPSSSSRQTNITTASVVYVSSQYEKPSPPFQSLPSYPQNGSKTYDSMSGRNVDDDSQVIVARTYEPKGSNYHTNKRPSDSYRGEYDVEKKERYYSRSNASVFPLPDRSISLSHSRNLGKSDSSLYNPAHYNYNTFHRNSDFAIGYSGQSTEDKQDYSKYRSHERGSHERDVSYPNSLRSKSAADISSYHPSPENIFTRKSMGRESDHIAQRTKNVTDTGNIHYLNDPRGINGGRLLDSRTKSQGDQNNLSRESERIFEKRKTYNDQTFRSSKDDLNKIHPGRKVDSASNSPEASNESSDSKYRLTSVI